VIPKHLGYASQILRPCLANWSCLPSLAALLTAAMAGCVETGGSKSAIGDVGGHLNKAHSEPPAAWLVLRVDAEGRGRCSNAFASSAAAKEYVANARMRSFGGGDSPHYEVVRDSPELHVQVNGFAISKECHLTVRSNWIQRNGKCLAPLILKSLPAIALTWEEGRPKDLLCARVGGKGVLPDGTQWPTCNSCGSSLSFVGVLDFRASVLAGKVPGAALSYFHCKKCLGGSGRVFWLKDEVSTCLVTNPREPSNTETRIGAPHPIDDLPWIEQSVLEGLNREAQFLLGKSPHFFAPAFTTKVGGHMFWIQRESTPKCTCGAPMTFIGQFADNGDSITIGDTGLAYLFQCIRGTCKESKVVIQTF